MASPPDNLPLGLTNQIGFNLPEVRTLWYYL